jgi:hypothetical protein
MIQITDIGGDKREFYRPVRLCNTQHALKGELLSFQGVVLGSHGSRRCTGLGHLSFRLIGVSKGLHDGAVACLIAIGN